MANMSAAPAVGEAEVQAKYVVMGDHTLCHRIAGLTNTLGVLAGSVIRGGHNPLYGPVGYNSEAELRNATLEDFEFFRVCPKGHIA